MFRASLLSAAAVVAVLVLPVAPAHATLVLPAASITLPFDQSSSGTFTFVHTASGASEGASASVDESSGPTLSATSSGQSFAAAMLTYYAAINAPAGVTSVPIDIAYSYALVGITDGTANPVLNPSAAFMRFSYSGISPIDIINNNTSDNSGVANGPAIDVTEPGGLLLLGASLLGCGLLGHRSRQHPAASADVT